MYLCLKCGTKIDNLAPGTIRCPKCGHKVFSKLRDPITKTLKAE